MYAIERDNPRLKGVLPRDYARRGILAERLGEFIDLISGIGLGDEKSRAKEVLGRVSLYFPIRKSTTIDWTIKETVRAQMRAMVRRLLRKYKYPPDQQEAATELVLAQAETLSSSLTT